MPPPRAQVQEDRAVIADERDANTLYNKGAFGTPMSGGGLELDLVEALYLVEHNRLDVQGHDIGSLLRHASRREPGFEIRYIVYRDLRNRTFVVKRANVIDFHVYPRGGLPGRNASTHLVRSLSERDSLDPAAVLAEAERTRGFGKKLMLAIVDEEGDLTYYDATEHTLTAKAPALPAHTTQAHLLEDRVMVTERDAGERLFHDGWFGRDVGIGHQLSLPEALHLADNDRLDVRDAATGERVTADDLAARAARIEPEFELRHALYTHLRGSGLVVKTGFKFGTHFRIYRGSPDEEHAPFLVHAVPEKRRLAWPEVAGFVRLAHGVRKRLFFAAPDGDGRFRLLELARRKP